MVAVGGPRNVTDAIRASDGQIGPRSAWAGAWMLKSGYGSLDTFYNGCRTDNIQPLVLLWVIGDDDGIKFLTTGVTDMYQNVWKTKQDGLNITREVARRAKTAGVSPIIVLNNEFNRGPAMSASPDFARFYDEQVAIIRQECPTAKICFPPGAWGDLTAIASYYAPQIVKSDMVGLQRGFFHPREPNSANLAKVGEGLAYAFSKLGTSKPRLIYDCFLSTYGGNYSTAHPFPGGDGRALEAQQAQGIASLAQVPDLTAIVYRDLKDNPTFDIANHGGWAERFVGLSHSDGTPKPALAELIKLSKTASTTQTPTPAPMPTTATFSPKWVNQNWIQIEVNPMPASVAILHNGIQRAMVKQSWPGFGYSMLNATNDKVQFTATYADGTKVTSPTYVVPTMAVFTAPPPEPKVYTQAEYDTLKTALAQSKSDLATMTIEVGTLRSKVSSLEGLLADRDRRIAAAKAALG